MKTNKITLIGLGIVIALTALLEVKRSFEESSCNQVAHAIEATSSSFTKWKIE